MHDEQIIPGLTQGLSTMKNRKELINKHILRKFPEHPRTPDGYALITIEKLGPVYKEDKNQPIERKVRISELKKDDLKQICRSYGINYPGSLKKDALRTHITDAILEKHPNHEVTDENQLIFTILEPKKKPNKLLRTLSQQLSDLF